MKTVDPLTFVVELDEESVRVRVRWWEGGEEGSLVQVVMGEEEEEEELCRRMKSPGERGKPVQVHNS